MTPSAYLTRLATARPPYCLLYQEAIGVLGPAKAGTCRTDPIACGLSLAELGKRLGLTRSVVSEELRRLVSHGWVTDERPRLLGHRKGVEPILLADVAAEEATGEKTVVSRIVLGVDLAREESKPAGRGLARRFEL